MANSKSAKILICSGLAATILAVTGCANMNTIGRQTTLPSQEGKAVHLDIQQRLLVVNNAGKFCSEPSPDALAAFAAAVGISASAPTQGAISAAGGGNSTAASVGLRTQSITLMRDALYRMCEAYANGQLGDAEVMTLLSRSQDLTAAILAIEQLTGAVVAQQAALTTSTSADATAVMAATADLLSAALKQEERAQERLEEAMAKKAEAEGKKAEAKQEQEAANEALNAAEADSAAAKAAESRLEKANRALAAAERDVGVTEQIRLQREQILKAAQDRVAALQDAQDSAATTAAASTMSGTSFAALADRDKLNDASTEAIANAVQNIVFSVTQKTYVQDYCMAILSNLKSKSEFPDMFDFCKSVVREAFLAEQKRTAEQQQVYQFRTSNQSDCIAAWVKADPVNNGKRLDAWLATNADNLDRVIFIYSSNTSLQDRAINDLPIPCS